MSSTARDRTRPLQGSWSADRDWLTVSYTLISLEPHYPILVFDGATRPATGEPPDLTDQVYVSFEPPETVHVKRVYPPLPREKDITSVRVPAVSRVQPGAVREVTLRLRLPLRERSEYFPHAQAVPYSTRRARRLVLSLGYLRETEGVVVEAIDAQRNIHRLRGAVREQRFFTVEGSCDLEVQVRLDPAFERV